MNLCWAFSLTRGHAARLAILFITGPAPVFLVIFLLGLVCADHVGMLLAQEDAFALLIGFAVYFGLVIPLFGLNIALVTALICFSYKALMSRPQSVDLPV